jgi:Ca-activated chloride channel family protein
MSLVLRHWFANPISLALLAVLPVLGIMALFSLYRYRRALARLGTAAVMHSLARRGNKTRILRRAIRASVLILVIIATAGPRSEWRAGAGEWQVAPGRDVVIVLDLSRSMLAQDVLPNRAERAKAALVDLSYAVQQRGGHRLALVAFASRARVYCPLTHDYDHFREALADLDPAHLPPDLRGVTDSKAVPPDANNTPQSGTRIGAGLRAAVEEHDPRFDGYQDILLLSDGDDPARDGEWRQGLEQARHRHIPVHTVGIGDPIAGSPIAVKNDEPLRYKGRVVMTRLEEEPLKEIARLTGGSYTPARSSRLELGDLFYERIASKEAREETEDMVTRYRPHHAWFCGAAVLLLGVEMVLGRGKLKARDRA